MKYLIANFKSELNNFQLKNWIDDFQKLYINENLSENISKNKLAIIICPPFSMLYMFKELKMQIPEGYIGAQSVSKFANGAHTGEITAESIKDFASYVIIGHSERRENNYETEDDILLQISQAKKYNIKTILCIRDEKDIIHNDADIVAYEPKYAIGTGIQPKLSEILDLKTKLKNLNIDGCLVGRYCVNASDFVNLIKLI
jgi:triosephosphate isomerase